jgi:hypothetical protein
MIQTLFLLAQVAPAVVEIPWWLKAFAAGALLLVGLWLLILVRHAAREEREYRASQDRENAQR